jgi:hypothetical protein
MMRGRIMDKNIIKEFIEDSKHVAFHFVYEENSGKIRVLDNHGYEISPESAAAIIEGMTKAYINLSDVEINNIRKRNAENELWKYSYLYGPRALETLFRKNLKRDWGFTCRKCGKKVSSKTDNSWWRIEGPDYESNHKYCSEQCIQPVVSEIKQKIKMETYERFGVK